MQMPEQKKTGLHIYSNAPLHTWSIGMCIFEINLDDCNTFNAVNKVMCLLIGFTSVFLNGPYQIFTQESSEMGSKVI